MDAADAERAHADACAREAAGTLRVVAFFGHTPRAPGPGPWMLSQWWPAPFADGGEVFATAEHYMMAAKAEVFGDLRARAAVLAADGPREAKALGRTVAGFDEAVWREHRLGVVHRASALKFGQNAPERAYLLSTAGALLVEASPYDRVWGAGVAADHADVARPGRWPGANLLGYVLVDVRDGLGRAPADA